MNNFNEFGVATNPNLCEASDQVANIVRSLLNTCEVSCLSEWRLIEHELTSTIHALVCEKMILGGIAIRKLHKKAKINPGKAPTSVMSVRS